MVEPQNGIGIRRVGSSVVLVSLTHAASEFGTTVPQMRSALKSLFVPTVLVDGEEYLNLFALEQTLFEALRPGRESWAFGETPPEYAGSKCGRLSHWMEMGLASLTYSHASTTILKQRVRNVARMLYRREVRAGGRSRRDRDRKKEA